MSKMTNDSGSLASSHRNPTNVKSSVAAATSRVVVDSAPTSQFLTSSGPNSSTTAASSVMALNDRIDDDFHILLSDSNSAAYEACKNGDIALARQLIHQANVNTKDTHGRKSTFLHFAAGFGRKEVCEYLLNECKADPSIKDEGYMFYAIN